MNGDNPAANGDGPAAWVVAAVIVAAIVVLLLFARGPEDQERSAAPREVAAMLIRA
jgi:hypothetical protein